MPSRYCTKIALFLSGLLAVSTVGLAATSQYGRPIVRDPSDQFETLPPYLWLVPIQLLQKPLSDWTQEERDRVPLKVVEDFYSRVERARSLGVSGACSPGEGIDTRRQGSSSPDFRTSLTQVATSGRSVIIGEVVAAEPALDVVTQQIATLVHLRVQQILQNRDSVAVGDVITLRRAWGSTTVRGVTLCSYQTIDSGPSDDSLAGPVERDRQTMLVIGRIAAGNRSFFDSGRFEQFQVIDGYVHYPRDVASYKDNKPEVLDSIIDHFRRGTP